MNLQSELKWKLDTANQEKHHVYVLTRGDVVKMLSTYDREKDRPLAPYRAATLFPDFFEEIIFYKKRGFFVVKKEGKIDTVSFCAFCNFYLKMKFARINGLDKNLPYAVISSLEKNYKKWFEEEGKKC